MENQLRKRGKCMVVYAITNIMNGKQYIGATINKLWVRWSHHKSCARRGSPEPIYDAMREFGIDNFVITQIATAVTQDELYKLEVDFILKLNTREPNGYNATIGGMGGRGKVLSEEVKKKIGDSKRGRKFSKEHCAKLSQVRTGKKRKPFTDLHKFNLSQSIRKSFALKRQLQNNHTETQTSHVA